MTIDEAKRVRIVDFLAQLGHRAQYMKSEQYWYLSPLRKEVTPSFKVNDRLNEWYDFGEATGGDLVELGKYLCGTKSVSEALAYIKRYVNGVSLPKTRALPATSRPVEADMKNLIIVPLRHHALLSYLHSRMIDSDIGRMFCKEVHYELRQRRYFALAFGNISGGYEVRNPYYKGCIKNKDISLIPQSRGEAQSRVCLFEGFMDFLSAATLGLETGDCLVLNSISNVEKAMRYLDGYGRIDCYLDRDEAGRRTLETLKGHYGERIYDRSALYDGCKDLNEYLQLTTKKRNEQ